MPFKRKKIAWIILSVLLWANAAAWSVVYDLSRSRLLKVDFFDVGQGESIFIETSQRQQILIDGGPDSSILEKLAKEMLFYDKTIDLIILTHPERDHLNGLLEVLKRYKVENILWTGVIRKTPEWREWNRLIKEEKARLATAQAGQKIVLSRSEFIDILYPFEN
jgi:competence protein ComEC